MSVSVSTLGRKFDTGEYVSDSDEDDLSSLESGSLEESDDDEYFENDLIPDEESEVDDEVVVIPSRNEGTYTDDDFMWRTGYTTRWKQFGNNPNSNNSNNNQNILHSNGDLLKQRSKSELNLSESSLPKKRLSVDLHKPDEESGSSFFRSISNWFRGSTRSARSNSSVSSQNNEQTTTQQEPVKSILRQPSIRHTRAKSDVGTAFSSFVPDPIIQNHDKKVIRFSNADDSSYSDDDTSEESSTESSSSQNTKSVFETSGKSSAGQFDETLHASVEVIYYLRSSEQFQCLNWQRLFGKYPGIEVECKDVNVDLVADAMIIPGNSFGFLDGEPEIQYVNIFGWEIQRRLRQIICKDYDGELLVGQAVLLPMKIGQVCSTNAPTHQHDKTDSDSQTSDSSEDGSTSERCLPPEGDKVYCKTVKNLIYVPVMRVPIHVQDTVNAYLSFSAALRTVKSHNASCDEEAKIRSVICPALCSNIGRMPAGRIALQMKTAYDTFVLNKRPELRLPVDLGTQASCHVQMSSVKNGNWC